MLKLILVVMMLLVVDSPAIAAKGRLAQIHVEYFELRDDILQDGLSLGRYWADSPNCYLHIKQNGHGGFKRGAFCYFVGPALYGDETIVPGTEDDVLGVEYSLIWEKSGSLFTFTVDQITIFGSSIEFHNGVPIEYPIILPPDSPIGNVFGTAWMDFNSIDIDTFTHFDGVQSKVLSEFEIEWEQSMDGSTVDFVEIDSNIKVPEPSMVLSLAAGALLLVGFKGRRYTNEHKSK